MRSSTATIACLLAVAAPRVLEAADPERPNLVLVVADDLGYRELGCYGQRKIRTPHLDRLAADGMRFTQHYAGAPVCAPSRCVLLTGRHSGHATIRDNQEHRPEGQAPLLPSDVTLAELLRRRGYRTGCFGKWGLGYPGSEGDPLVKGFERFYGYNCQRHAHNFYPRYLWSDHEKVALEGNDRGVSGERYSHDLIAREALRFVEEHRDEPFFLYLPVTIPHLALQVPQRSLAEYLGQWEETPYEGTSYLPHPTPRAAYAAMISHLDRTIGELVARIETLGLAERTLILFTSDNGTTHLREQVDAEFFGSVGELRGLKGSVHEGGLRVPLIARWRGRIERGAVSDHVSGFQDFLPTLCELAGADVPDGLDGLSFAPTLLGNASAQRQHTALVWDFPGYGGQLAIRSGRWKALRRNLRRDPDAPLELYDLAVDPGETRDLAAVQPYVAAQLAQWLVEERTKPVFEAFVFGTYGGE